MFRVRFLAAVVLGFALAGCAMLTGCGGEEQPDTDTENVFFGRVSEADSVAIEEISPDSTTVFDLLIEGHEVDYQFYGRNVFVTAIDSVYQGNNHMWLYSVNGDMSRHAANHHRIGPGDTVRWLFRDITE